MSWKTAVLGNAFTDGVCHRFLLPRSLLIFTACLHIHISKVDAAMNDTSVRMYVEPSPSLKRPNTGTIQRPTGATVLKSGILNNAMRTNYKTMAVGLISKTQITQLNNGSSIVGHNTEEAENYGHIRKDKSVVFYRRIGGWITLSVIIIALVFLTVTHFSSIRHMNRNEQIREPFCSILRKPQSV